MVEFYPCLNGQVKGTSKAFLKVRKYKRYNQEVLGFEYNLERELFKLKEELQGLTYEPKRPQRLIVYEPARREIIIPAFRDRIIQQALLQVIEPVFEKSFIFDSYAFRIGKGSHFALERFDKFKRKVSPRKFPNSGHILKADIKNYYPSVDRWCKYREMTLGILKGLSDCE